LNFADLVGDFVAARKVVDEEFAKEVASTENSWFSLKGEARIGDGGKGNGREGRRRTGRGVNQARIRSGVKRRQAQAQGHWFKSSFTKLAAIGSSDLFISHHHGSANHHRYGPSNTTRDESPNWFVSFICVIIY